MKNVIKKKISIEDNTSRMRGLIPSVDMGYYAYDNSLNAWVKKYITNTPNEYIVIYSNDDLNEKDKVYFSYGLNGKNGKLGNWGKIPMDIIIDEDSIISRYNLPFDKNGNTTILRYYNMVNAYYWLNKFIKTSSIYRLCKRNNNKEWVYTNNFTLLDYYGCYFYDDKWHEENVERDLFLFKSLTDVDINAYSFGDIIIINNAYFDDYKRYFGNMNDTSVLLSHSIIFYHFVEKAFGKLYIPEKIGGTLVPTYIDYYDISEWYNWLNNNKNINDKTTKYKYENMGGDDMLEFLKNKVDLFNETILYFSKLVTNPYDSFHLFIDNKIDDLGIYDVYSQEWAAGKKYYVGDTVIYTSEDDIKGNSYTLKYGENYDLIKINNIISFPLSENSNYNIVQYDNYADILTACSEIISIKDGREPHFIENGKKIIYISKNDNAYYLPLAYYIGNQDENTYEIFFDEINDNGRLVHWESNCGEIYNDNWEEESVNLIKSHGVTKLSIFERLKRSYDDNGKELPGIITYYTDEDNNININNHLELPFLLNVPLNIVNIFDEDGKRIKSYGDILLEPVKNEGDKITFTYYIGCELTDEYECIENTGIKYVETYKYSEEIIDNISIDGKKISFNYIKIDFGENKKYNTAEITHKSNDFHVKNGDYNYINSILYKDEDTIGIVSPFKINVNLDIDRGNTTAYDKYYMLSEVKNISDLEHYRNNYFNIKK